MLIFYKTLTDISLQSDQMVCGAFLKTTLIFSYYVIVLQKPCETMNQLPERLGLVLKNQHCTYRHFSQRVVLSE